MYSACSAEIRHLSPTLDRAPQASLFLQLSHMSLFLKIYAINVVSTVWCPFFNHVHHSPVIAGVLGNREHPHIKRVLLLFDARGFLFCCDRHAFSRFVRKHIYVYLQPPFVHSLLAKNAACVSIVSLLLLRFSVLPILQLR